MARRHVVATDDSRTINLRVGDVAVVELVESPTTGYRWQVEFGPPLTLQSSEWHTSSRGIGGSGTRLFVFRAVATGTTRVEARLLRSWVGDSSMTLRHCFVFSVR